MCSFFDEIYKLQGELNVIIGRDTINSSDKYGWLYDYLEAFDSEVFELKNCINWKHWIAESKNGKQYLTILDPANAKLETIDILHFFVSICQITDIQKLDFIDPMEIPPINTPSVDIFVNCNKLLESSLQLKKFTGYDSKLFGFLKGRTEIVQPIDSIIKCEIILEMWFYLQTIFKALELDKEHILDIYKQKHAVNIERQKNNYAQTTKTEEDNEMIKKNL